MKALTRRLVVAALVLLPFVLAPSASATSGTLVITSNTTLTEDHFGSIVIDADNITLDGAGHTLYGSGAPPYHGVLVSGHTGVTIKNLRASGFILGAGFFVGFTDTPTSGISLLNNIAEQDHVGFALDRVTNSVLAGNRSSNHLTNGFAVTTSSNHNVLRGNAAIDTEGHGFVLVSSSDNRLERNVATGNALEGIGLFEGSNRNRVVGNSAEANGTEGFLVMNSTTNTLARNRALRNGDPALPEGRGSRSSRRRTTPSPTTSRRRTEMMDSSFRTRTTTPSRTTMSGITHKAASSCSTRPGTRSLEMRSSAMGTASGCTGRTRTA